MRRLEARGVRLTYLGDLDSKGIQMADHLFGQLQVKPLRPCSHRPTWPSGWPLRASRQRNGRGPLAVQTAVFQQEMDAVNLVGKFVEQEQLITEYERLIGDWVKA